MGLKHAERVVDDLRINKNKISIVIEERGDFRFEPDQGPSLQDRVRPIGGGLFIEVPKWPSPQRGCSIGFVAKREQSKAIMVHAIGVLFTTGATMAAAVLLSVK